MFVSCHRSYKGALLELIAQRQELADQVEAVVWAEEEEEEEVTLDYHLPLLHDHCTVLLASSTTAPLHSLKDVYSNPPCHIPHLMHEIPS